jgi:pSer/pThr/pTyr-binding forkhead associated (FHA) protein
MPQLLFRAGSVCDVQVVSGPSAGSKAVWPAANASGMPYSLGRIPENDLVVNDPEVSGRHATFTWHRQVGIHLFNGPLSKPGRGASLLLRIQMKGAD